MALTNQRFVTTWTSEDSIQWRMYIIPSSVNYVTGGSSTNVTLPAEFLLRDMSLDTELGSIPAGLVSQVLKISVNIAALQGTTALNDLRADLLRGTTTKRKPLNADGSEYLASDLTEEQRQFDAFNTFVLQYNDGSGWKVAFIGCQKYSAENEIEVTALDNVVRFSIEIYDIMRCIGEIISPDVWKMALRVNSDSVAYSTALTRAENTSVDTFLIGKHYYNSDWQEGNTWAVDSLGGNYLSYVSTFKRLKEKIGTMYSAYMRAITQKLSSSFTAHQFFTQTAYFYTMNDENNEPSFSIVTADYLCYIAEIWEITPDGTRLVSGAHKDFLMFEQFTNFHEVYRSLTENAIEIARMEYGVTTGTPDAYTVTVVASNPYPILGSPSIEFDQDNTYGNLKIKMFSEALNQVNVAVSGIKGETDTKSFEYGKQGTSGDNSKDLKIMFHNVPLITSRGLNSALQIDNKFTWHRSTVNSGTMLYFDPAEFIGTPQKVSHLTTIFFGGEDFAQNSSKTGYTNKPQVQMLLDQQESGLPTTMALAMVNFLGRPKQAEGSLTSTYTTVKFSDIGKRCEVNLNDYNTLLQSIYGADKALAVIVSSSHKIYEGMTDITLRIDAEAE
jgi:hypothetical protein